MAGRIVVLVDRDDDACAELKQRLEMMAQCGWAEYLVAGTHDHSGEGRQPFGN